MYSCLWLAFVVVVVVVVVGWASMADIRIGLRGVLRAVGRDSFDVTICFFKGVYTDRIWSAAAA